MTGATRSIPVKLMEFETGLLSLSKREYGIVLKHGSRLNGIKAAYMNYDFFTNWQSVTRLKGIFITRAALISFR